MRRLIGVLLAASILAPATAQAQREGYRGDAAGRAERGGPRGDGGNRLDRGPDGFRPDRSRPDAPSADPARPDAPRADTPRPDRRGYGTPRPDDSRGDRWSAGPDGRGDRDRADWRRDRGVEGRADGIPRGADLRAGRPNDDRRYRDGRPGDGGRGPDDARGRDDGRGRGWTSSRFDGNRGDWRDDRRGDRDGWNRGDRGRAGWDDRGRDGIGWSGRDGNRWDPGWHGQSRYDWTRYRDANRGAFRLARYYAPSGWNGGYRRFGIGFSLSGALWERNYWIADPYAYRLPEVYGPYRWVRYYDDALLVDVRSGQVVDAVYGIFW